jgi:hypothetical protein
MVPWLSPKFLIGAGIEVAVSSAFSRLLDKRELAAGQPGYGQDLEPGEGQPPAPPFTDASYRDDEHALWIDYAADVGEGFDSTFTVAWLLGQKALELEPGLVTKRGRALVLGGDQVYPSAGWAAYRDRFFGPYRAALPHLPEDQVPHLFAIPGNHDWYDGLTSFTRLFTQRSWIGAWRTRQRRSYFVLRLSKRWWLWATDIQFDTYLDGPQLEYFRKASADLEEGHRVILATAKPSWVGVKKAENPTLRKEGAWETLSFVEEKLIGESKGQLAVTISGDHHHYAHYSRKTGEGPLSRITAGGGGAHSMGTRGLSETIKLPSLENPDVSATYELEATSPTPDQSDAIRDNGVMRAVMRVAGLGRLIGAMYFLIALAVADAVKDQAPGLTGLEFPNILADAGSQWSIGALVLLAFGLYKFADVKTDPALKRKVAVRHWLEHVLLALVPAFALMLLLDDTGIAEEGMLVGWIAAVVSGLIGYFAGRWVFARYLLRVNRTGPKRHSGEIWGSIASTDYKNFLRMKIDRDERLTIYPVGIPHSVEWRFEPQGGEDDPWFVPEDKPPEPHLIEPPIVIEP